MGALLGISLAAGSVEPVRPPPPGFRAPEHVSQRPVL